MSSSQNYAGFGVNVSIRDLQVHNANPVALPTNDPIGYIIALLHDTQIHLDLQKAVQQDVSGASDNDYLQLWA